MSLNKSLFIDNLLKEKIIFTSDIQYLQSSYNQNVFTTELPIGVENNLNKNVFNFCSNELKVIVSLSISFFHFYTEEFSTLLMIHKIYPSIEVIVIDTIFIDEKNILNSKNISSEIKMFFLFLIDNNINFKIVNIKNIKNTPINNFIVSSFFQEDSRNQANLLSDMSKKYIYPIDKKNKTYIRTGRIKNEGLLEKYLISLGFDIIAKNSFNSFIEQMNYFYNCKILISATSGGLVNSSFMKNQSLVVELITLVAKIGGEIKENGIAKVDEYEIHHIYDTLSLQKNHIYVGLSNIDKTAEDIIEQIENNQFLRVALEQA